MRPEKPTSLNILWHDDELQREDRYSLAPWRNWLQAIAFEANGRLACSATLEGLGELLRATNCTWHLIILDMRLAHEPDRTLAALGFPTELLLRVDAGLQIAALMRSSRFDGKRPTWLQSVSATPLVLFSSSRVTEADLISYLGNDRRNGVTTILKSLDVREGSVQISLDADRNLRSVLSTIRIGATTDGSGHSAVTDA